MRGKLLLIVVALAAMALAAPAGSSAATCPEGQVGTPPYCTTAPPPVPPTPVPSNNFKLGRAKQKGLAVAVRVTIPDPGRLTASARGLRKLRVARKGAGSFTVKLKPTGAGLGAIRGSGKLKVRVRFTFKPTGGTARTKSKAITFRP